MSEEKLRDFVLGAVAAFASKTEPRCEECGGRASYRLYGEDGLHSFCSDCMDALCPEESDEPGPEDP